MDKIENEWVSKVLDFWFGELGYEDWFGGDEKLDGIIRSRFLDLHEQLKSSFTAPDATDARTALAAIILFDQFPRNMFRRTPEAFATDALATSIARYALDKEFDQSADEKHKPFFYMPFMHSEVLADQERCVDLFRALGESNSLKYAIEHRDIVAAYGRFPHRNNVLGRESTPEELEFLKGHSGYGQ